MDCAEEYDAGYDVVLGVDFDEAALKIFKENYGIAEAMKLDLFDHSNIDIITNYLKERHIELEVIVGGPHCQKFSILGPRDMNDKRNSLYLEMVKLLITTLIMIGTISKGFMNAFYQFALEN